MEIGAAGWAMIASAVATASAGTYSAMQSAHAAKQQKRMATETQVVSQIEQAEQKEVAARERRALVDQQREGIDLSKHYRTSTREKGIADSGLRGKLEEDILG